MRTRASSGPGGSIVNSSTTPGAPGSRAMTPRATIDPLPLLAEDSATGLLLISTRGVTDFQVGQADYPLSAIVTYLPGQRTPPPGASGGLRSGRPPGHLVRSDRPSSTIVAHDDMRGGVSPWRKRSGRHSSSSSSQAP